MESQASFDNAYSSNSNYYNKPRTRKPAIKTTTDNVIVAGPHLLNSSKSMDKWPESNREDEDHGIDSSRMNVTERKSDVKFDSPTFENTRNGNVQTAIHKIGLRLAQKVINISEYDVDFKIKIFIKLLLYHILFF